MIFSFKAYEFAKNKGAAIDEFTSLYTNYINALNELERFFDRLKSPELTLVSDKKEEK